MENIQKVSNDLLELKNTNIILPSEYNTIIEIIKNVENRLFDNDCVIVDYKNVENRVINNDSAVVEHKNCLCTIYSKTCTKIEDLKNCKYKDEYIKTFPKISFVIDEKKMNIPMNRTLIYKNYNKLVCNNNITFLLKIIEQTHGGFKQAILTLILFNYIIENWNYVLSNEKIKNIFINKVNFFKENKMKYIRPAEDFLNEHGIFDVWYNIITKFKTTI